MSDMTTRAHEEVGAGAIEEAPGTPPDSPDTVGADDLAWSRGHRIVFRVFSVLLALVILATSVFALLEPVIMWLPGDVLLGLDDGAGPEWPGGFLVHRAHFMAMGLVAWTIVPAIVVQVRKPWRRVAPMLVAVVMAIATLVAYGLDGTLQAWLTEDVIPATLVFGLAVLHPRVRDVFRRPTFDRDMIRWAVVGAVPWAVYGLIQAQLQFRPAPGDIHAGGLEHWAKALLMAVAIITCAVIGASDHDGWRLPAWTAALVSVLFGVHSLVFPGLASGLPLIAALAAVAWGVVYAVALVRRSRAGTPAT